VSTATVDSGLGRVLTPEEGLEKDDAGHESVDLPHMRHTASTNTGDIGV
jgi:hypothetical protein